MICLFFIVFVTPNNTKKFNISKNEYDSFREGYDVHTNANISISQAILGGIIRIKVMFIVHVKEKR